MPRIRGFFIPIWFACWIVGEGGAGGGPACARAQSLSAPADTLRLPLVTRVRFPFCSAAHTELASPRIGLVLSGGGARGLAQIGVLKALEEEQIPISFIVGTSIGSVVGGLYAAGYNAADLERTLHETDWNRVLRFTDQASREDILFEKRAITDQSIFSLRFDNLRPVLPPAVSNGQRLTNLLNLLVLQGIYHPRDSFDDLRIPFRAVTTDLYSGKRVILDRGNLAEAMRASATVPVFYAAVHRDSMALVDGGLISNIPVDVARTQGCAYVIAVNTTSSFRAREDIANPLQTLDQVLNVMMAQPNAAQLTQADLAITPELDPYGAFDFDAIDSLIRRGYDAARAAMPRLRAALEQLGRRARPALPADSILFRRDGHADVPLNGEGLYDQLARLYATDAYEEVYAVREGSVGFPVYRLQTQSRPAIAALRISGNASAPAELLTPPPELWLNRHCSNRILRDVTESVIRKYRERNFSFAAIDSLSYDERTGTLSIRVDEGRIGAISISGNTRTDAMVILREFPLAPNDIFRFDKAREGLANIAGLDLFHQVTLDIDYGSPAPRLAIRVEERSSQLLRFGVHADDERNAQITLDLRDENLFGTGSDAGVAFRGGLQNRIYEFHYNSNRLFWTSLIFKANAYWGFRDLNIYQERSDMPTNRFERIRIGTYRQTQYGAVVGAGSMLRNFGTVTFSLKAEQQSIRSILNDLPVDESQRVVSFLVGATIDSRDRFPFPRSGVQLNGTYESAQTPLGSEIAFSKMYVNYEIYASPLETLTLHPRVRFGFGDKTLPLTEQFSLGGQHSFFGMRENDFFGRQIFTSSLEVRYLLPIRFIFESHLAMRYDLGTTWDVPEQIRFKDLRHGIGATLGLDTPIGPAEFSIGRSFLIRHGLAQSIIALSPTYLYFSIGAPI